MFANEITNGSYLAHQHANKNILQKRTHCRRFLGELTKQTTSKEVEERPELEIMEKTPYSGNKNYFHFRTYMIKHYTYGYFSGIQWSSDVICCKVLKHEASLKLSPLAPNISAPNVFKVPQK